MPLWFTATYRKSSGGILAEVAAITNTNGMV